MALVPWKYSNPFVDRKSMPVLQFTFTGKIVEVAQDTEADIDLDQNTGLRLWDGAYLLSKCIETSKDFGEKFWEGKSCIELGCGCGLAGTVAWLLGANVILTDMEDTLTHTTKNLEKNFENWKSKGYELPKREALKLETLLWGVDNCHKYTNKKFDIILGSDIIYQPEVVELLLETLDRFSSDQTLILIAYKPRGLGEHVFFEKLSHFSFECSTIPKSSYPVEFCASDYVILKINRNRYR